MSVPAFRFFIDPLLRYLGERPDGAKSTDAYEALADRLELAADDRAELLPSGTQPLYRNRIGWAHDRLKRRGWSSSPRRGFWQVTEKGLQAIKSFPGPMSEVEVRKVAYPPGISRSGSAKVEPLAATPPDDDSQGPEEKIESGLRELRDSVGHDLLELTLSNTPVFFETLVLDLLHAMGYGATRGDVRHVGQSGDEGIDGVISLDRLGLEKVYVQAKRYKKDNIVGRPAIQAFYGALAGKKATKGVFITTSSYSREAHEFAQQVEHIVLVDGNRLAELMIEHGVGVSHTRLRVPKLDTDYFEEA